MRRILLRTLATLVVVIVGTAAFVFIRSEIALRKIWRVDASALTLPTDATALAQGEHVAITRGCTGCHAADLGGSVVMEVPPIGRMAAPNITAGKGSSVAGFTPADWDRAIRHGIKPDGHAMLFMPIRDYNGLSDADTASLIAYVLKQAPVDRDISASYVGPIGRALFAFGQLPMQEARLIDQGAAHPVQVQAVATAEYGSYLAQSCTGCHGEHLSGGRIPGTPPDFPVPANITPDQASGIGSWNKTDFQRVFREGKKPGGSPIDEFMPWKAMGRFTDTELDALWAYLQTVPPRTYGQR